MKVPLPSNDYRKTRGAYLSSFAPEMPLVPVIKLA